MLADRFDKRLLFFTGKGGVGKTCLSAAAALAHARRGRRTLLVELGGEPQAGRLFAAARDVTYEPLRLLDDVPLYACRITTDEALHEYAALKLKVERVARWVFDHDFLRRLLDMVPGMDELLRIGRIWFLEQMRGADDRPRFDRIIVDAPATGHGLSLLQLPGTILDVVRAGPFARDTRPILEMLTDRQRTMVHLVALPEELPVRETVELAQRLTGDLDLGVGACFVNKVWPPTLTAHEGEQLRAFRAAVRGADADLDGLLARVQVARGRQASQAGQVRRLGADLGQLPVPVPVIEVPYLFTDEIGPAELDALSYPMGKEPQA